MMYYTQLQAKSCGEDADIAKLNYLDALYDTVLGATFAAMYPDRLGKFVLSSEL